MEDSKFIRALYKLTPRQQQLYLEFLGSPYFNKNEDIRRFVKLVFQRNTALSKEKLFAALYPGKPYEDRRIPDLMYKSLKLLEEFLSEEHYAGQVWERKLNLLSYIRENDLDDLNSVVQREIADLSQKKQLRDSNYFYEEFMYQSEANKIFLDHSRIEGDQSLQKKVEQLDLFYLAAKLRDSCEMMNRTRIMAADYEFHLLDNLLEGINTNFERYRQYPAISIYYRIMLMLKEPEEQTHFHLLQSQVQEHIHLFARDEQRSLYGYLQNYCIRNVNSGKAEFYPELLNIYKYMLGINLMNDDNKNLQWDLKNMVSIALRLGEYEWTYKTINDLKAKLPEEVRENAYAYNIANYYYETKDFKKATRLLQSVEFNDVRYNLDSKSMLLKIYFELEEEEAFYAHVTAFNAYLTRNKLISEDTLIIYGNLVKYARKAFIFKTQLPYIQRRNATKINALKDKISKTRLIGNANWLMKEVEAIEKGI